jgi:hypothetical protein
MFFRTGADYEPVQVASIYSTAKDMPPVMDLIRQFWPDHKPRTIELDTDVLPDVEKPPYRAEVKPSPVSSPTAKKYYQSAINLAAESGEISAKLLRDKLHIGDDPAREILRGMQDEGLIDPQPQPGVKRGVHIPPERVSSGKVLQFPGGMH